MEKSDLENYLEILKSFDTAMLVTLRGEEVRSRPMAVADTSPDGRIRFLTSIESGKLEEITDSPMVNVSMQSNSKFLSISGTAVATRDPDMIDKLWSATDNAWFPEGKDDPTVIVLEIVPTYAEYWDRSGIEGVKAFLELGKSVVTQEQPKFDDEVHQKLDFPDKMMGAK
jgi:general stress protein 26